MIQGSTYVLDRAVIVLKMCCRNVVPILLLLMQIGMERKKGIWFILHISICNYEFTYWWIDYICGEPLYIWDIRLGLVVPPAAAFSGASLPGLHNYSDLNGERWVALPYRNIMTKVYLQKRVLRKKKISKPFIYSESITGRIGSGVVIIYWLVNYGYAHKWDTE